MDVGLCPKAVVLFLARDRSMMHMEKHTKSVYARFLDHRGWFNHPLAISTWSIKELQEVESKAKALEIPLYVVFGHRSIAIATMPELVAYIEQSGNYEHIENLYAAGGDAQFNYHLFKWLDPSDPTIEE